MGIRHPINFPYHGIVNVVGNVYNRNIGWPFVKFLSPSGRRDSEDAKPAVDFVRVEKEGSPIRLEDIARESGVSIKTVSRAIHDHPDVSSATKSRVMKIVDKHNYSPNWAAQSLRSQKTHTVGFVVPNITNGYFGEIGMTMDRLFRSHRYATLISFTSNDHQIEIESLNSLINKNVDGIVFAPIGGAGDYFRKVPLLARKPLVIIDNAFKEMDAACVLHDNAHGAGLLVEHLYRHGHRRIACVTGPTEETSGAERLEGYRTALARLGLPYDESLVRVTNWEINGGDEAIRDLFGNRAQRPTAVFFANSQQLLGGYKAFNSLGLSLPSDVAVVSFDPPNVMDSLVPRPTTLEAFEEKIGSAAARCLLELIQGKKGARKRAMRIRGDVRVGTSCGCA